MNTSSEQQYTATTINFHGAAIIDADGREIPITEAMVQQALHSAIERSHASATHSNRMVSR